MHPQTALTPPPNVQQRLKKFIRQPDRLASRQLTDKGLQAIAIIEHYRFLPTSLLIRLMPGVARNNYRHLQTLFHHGYISRFALPKYGGPGEFIYFLESTKSLRLLIDRGIIPQPAPAEWKRKEQIIDTNRANHYDQLHRSGDVQGQLLFIQHELMVSRFHACLELAARDPRAAGKIQLTNWMQGPELYNKIEVHKVRPVGRDPRTQQTMWEELPPTETLPHRPDAFFTLYFPTRPEGKQHLHFFYEADRGTENTTRFKLKLRAHWHFIGKHQLNRQPPYNVPRIRAVLIESTNTDWANNLRQAAKENIVSPRPSPLFWFTSSAHFTDPQPATVNGRPRELPRYLLQPETVFKRIWHSAADDKVRDLSTDD